MTSTQRVLDKLPTVEGFTDERYDHIVHTMGDHFEEEVIENEINKDGKNEKYYTAWKVLEGENAKILIWIVEIEDILVDWGFA